MNARVEPDVKREHQACRLSEARSAAASADIDFTADQLPGGAASHVGDQFALKMAKQTERVVGLSIGPAAGADYQKPEHRIYTSLAPAVPLAPETRPGSH